MASAKDIKNKIRSISNTKKITRTMEMVATVKAKRGQNLIRATDPYAHKLGEVVRNLGVSGSVSHPLLASPGGGDADAGVPTGSDTPAKAAKTLVIVITGNRGLCGGYNMNVLSLAEHYLASEGEAGRETEVVMIGKKGISRFRFRGIPLARTITDLGDTPEFLDAEKLSRGFIERFLAGEVDRVVVIGTRYVSSSVQQPVRVQLLPFDLEQSGLAKETGVVGRGPAEAVAGRPYAEGVEFIFEPDRNAVLNALVPLAVKNAFYRILVESRAGEQIARRIAMKLATDNAETMIRTYTTQYNRQRQAGITQQIMEIVSGADAQG